eukprot:4220197-Lingulodinium_polyedra.AAC.1
MGSFTSLARAHKGPCAHCLPVSRFPVAVRSFGVRNGSQIQLQFPAVNSGIAMGKSYGSGSCATMSTRGSQMFGLFV